MDDNGTTPTPTPTHKGGISKLDSGLIAVGLSLASALIFTVSCVIYCKCCASKEEYNLLEGGGSQGCKEAFCCG